jgi:hypothetical protein
MHQQHDPALTQYPHGRGYGNDYMRGGEVLGGYGYAAREEYDRPIGELARTAARPAPSAEAPPGPEATQR